MWLLHLSELRVCTIVRMLLAGNGFASNSSARHLPLLSVVRSVLRTGNIYAARAIRWEVVQMSGSWYGWSAIASTALYAWLLMRLV